MDHSASPLPAMSVEHRYRLLVEAVTDYAIYLLDTAGHVSSWNAGAQRFKGYAESEILGSHFSRFYVDEDRQKGLPARALATAEREGKFEGEGWRQRKDGSRFWAHVVIDPIRDASGALIGFAKITRDLTERRLAEATLRRSQEQFRLLVQGVTDYAIYMLDADGFVSSWNAGAQRIKGYTEAEILGQHFSRFYTEEDKQAQVPARALATALQDGRFESEGPRVRKDGSQFWAHVVIDCLRDEHGALIGFAKVTRDVTARRETQAALDLARESLLQAQKVEAIGQLTGGVAHDFNNLLMVIVSSMELLRRRAGDDARLQALVGTALSAARRGASLTQRMLAFARRQELTPVTVDALALVQGMQELLRQSLGPAVLLQLPAAAAPLYVQVDESQLELALLNLAVNARDAMPDGGSLTISVQPSVIKPLPGASRPPLPAGPYVCISLRDTGQGMDEATLARATEPFFTTKGPGKGTGLGLSMIDGLASQLGGRFVLHSRPGEGTVAELWLPAVSAAGGAPATGSTTVAPTSQGLLILVVDDDELVLSSALAMLEELGHRALGAASASEALQLLRSEPGIQLLLTDHAMPHMTGAELITIARRELPDLPAILASGFAEVAIGQSPVNAPRLIKPFDLETLEASVAKAMVPSLKL
ncbi:MAG TPA: PAS domain S-box protein [Ideonella sp.]|uniref:hybrid sensor histidine kinase/response regulator n=1 Tax=Ideonella sp. TaxID=1929293 RepID=UPI002C83C8F2|nr:PAS domain S-box protein [Ideonella sp.]HSI46637.1 PAS domain S-box protein [Ideonella sp.]